MVYAPLPTATAAIITSSVALLVMPYSKKRLALTVIVTLIAIIEFEYVTLIQLRARTPSVLVLLPLFALSIRWLGIGSQLKHQRYWTGFAAFTAIVEVVVLIDLLFARR